MKKILENDLSKIIISSLLFIISLIVKKQLSLVLLIISYVIISYQIYIESFKSIKKKDYFNEFTLMILATLGAFYIHEYTETVIVMILYCIGEYLSDKAIEKSKSSLTKLMDLRVDKVHIIKNNKIIDKKIEEVQENEIFQVLVGEKIPLDGIVIEGESFIDTSLVTGESVPRKVNKEDKVLSGCINNESILKIKATTTSKTTTTTKILQLIEDSNKTSSKTEKFITKFSRIYTPIVVFCALVLIIVPSLITKDYQTWIYRGLVFLVTSCPCALIISVPLGYFCGIGVSTKYGAVIKGSNVLDDLTNIDYLLLDKTGTITEGVFEITKVAPKNIKESEFMNIIASSEAFSNHPIAKAIQNSYHDKLSKVEDFKEISGMGISCKINNEEIFIGNKKLLNEHNIKYDDIKDPNTLIHLAINNEYKGYLVISDKIKSQNKDLSKLIKIINKDIIVLSGDSKEIVENIAKKVKINNYYGELLPVDKVNKIIEYNKLGTTMFVGDGINDAPALTKANVGVSIGNIGTDAAIEASDLVLMNDNLNTIEKVIKISKSTKQKVVNAIFFALIVKFLILLLSIFGLSTIWLAVFADVGVTILSVLYVLTISFKKY